MLCRILYLEIFRMLLCFSIRRFRCLSVLQRKYFSNHCHIKQTNLRSANTCQSYFPVLHNFRPYFPSCPFALLLAYYFTANVSRLLLGAIFGARHCSLRRKAVIIQHIYVFIKGFILTIHKRNLINYSFYSLKYLLVFI